MKAWAFFRRKQFPEAKEEAKLAKDNDFARECLDYISAVSNEPQKVKKYKDCLPDDSILADSAIVIEARQKDSKTSREEVLKIANKWIGKDLLADQTFTANLANNVSRYFLAKFTDKENLELALWYMKKAIELYGEGETNLHHRASAHFWLSHIAEKMNDKESAITFIKKSVVLWKRQLKLDEENPGFKDALKGAQKRSEDLESQ